MSEQGLLIAIALSVGLGLIAVPLTAVLRSRRIAQWPRVTGKIICSTVVNPRDPEGAWPDIRYEYQAEGIRFVGKRVYAQPNTAIAAGGAAQTVCEQYPVGNRVEVFVNPANYSDSALNAGVEPRSWALALAFGAITTGIAGYALLSMKF